MPDEQELVSLVTRGFGGIQEQLRERDVKVTQLSEKMIGVEFQLAQLNRMVTKVEADISRAETERLKMRVDHLEVQATEAKHKQQENIKWIKGLVASVIVLLLGFLFNFVRISLRQ